MEKPKRKNGSFTSGSNVTGAYVLIGLGAVFLLVNVLDFSWGQLWPLLLIGLGVLLLLGREVSAAQTHYFNEPLDDATAADIDLNLSIGEATISALSQSDQLMDADLTYVGEVNFEVSGQQQKHIRLRQTGDSALQWMNPLNWFNQAPYAWRIGLSDQVPLSLNIQGGVGKAKIDLRRLQLTDLRLHGGVGEVDVRLPEARNGYAVDLHGGVGEIRMDLPPATDLDVRIQGGLGEITLSTPANSALRVEARGGMGDVKVPSGLKRLSSGGDFEMGTSGVWESPNFADAAQRITIDYHGGMGELKIR